VAVERLTPERRKELTRAALVDAAAELFARKGFVAASLDEIAEAAGFSRGAIHFHFDSKDDLFLAVLERYHERLLATYVELPLAGEAFAVDPAAIASAWKEIHDEGGVDHVLLQLEFRTYALRNPAFRARAAELEARAIAASAEFLAERAEAHGLRWRIPIEQVSGLLHVTSRGLLELSAVTGASSEPSFATFLSALWDSSLEPDPDAPTPRRPS
jgi:AcrR family transcriptional regulator